MSNVDHIYVYKDNVGQWRWTAIAANNEIVGEGESYTRHEDAIRAVRDTFTDQVKIVEQPRKG